MVVVTFTINIVGVVLIDVGILIELVCLALGLLLLVKEDETSRKLMLVVFFLNRPLRF